MNDLLFDLTASQPTSELKFHGGSEYCKFLFREGVVRGYKFDVIYRTSHPLHDSINALIKSSPNINAIPIDSNDDIQELLNKSDYRRFYSALPYEYGAIDLNQTEFVFTIHGIREIECPSDNWKYLYQVSYVKQLLVFLKHFFKLGLGKKKALESFRQLVSKSNKKIIVVSAHTKYSLLASFPELKTDDLKVIYSPFKNIQLSHKPLSQKYFLLVSTHRWIKNNYRALKAFDELFSNGRLDDYKVLCLGSQKTNFIKSLKNQDRFIFKDYVEEVELENYFADAFAFIYPTLNEGFGYPPIQAMQTLTPVIAACNTSVAEVCGNAALYFDNKSILEIKNRILQLFHSDELQKRLVKEGSKRVEELKEMQEGMLEEKVKMIFEFDS